MAENVDFIVRKSVGEDCQEIMNMIRELAEYVSDQPRICTYDCSDECSDDCSDDFLFFLMIPLAGKDATRCENNCGNAVRRWRIFKFKPTILPLIRCSDQFSGSIRSKFESSCWVRSLLFHLFNLGRKSDLDGRFVRET